jgi:hypothetical protein
MNYSLSEGIDGLVASMTEFESSLGDRFKPSSGWELLKE